MNPLYPLVEETLRRSSDQAVTQLIQQLGATPGQNQAAMGCKDNEQYVLQRLISACLSSDPDIKFSASIALQAAAQHISGLKVAPLLEYVLSQSDYKKHCGGKPSEVEAYAVGRILIVRALHKVFKNNPQIISSLSALASAFPALEEQSIQAIFELAHDKNSKQQLLKIKGSTKAGTVLLELLKARIKKQKVEWTPSVVQDLLEEASKSFPARSISVLQVGKELKNFMKNSDQWLGQLLQSCMGGQDQQVQIKKMHYALQLLQGHLSDAVITKQNVWQYLSVQMLSCWFTELKVQHKRIRRNAEYIGITFDADSELAMTVLQQLHEKQVYLDNISNKHPLYPLYEQVDTQKFLKLVWAYCAAQSEEEPNEEAISYIGQLEFFTVLRHGEISPKKMAQVLNFFVSRYHSAQNEQNLQAVSTILNVLLAPQKKKQHLMDRAIQVLTLVDIDLSQLGQHTQSVKESIEFVKQRFEKNKEADSPFTVSLLNFLLAVAFHSLVYPEQIDFFEEFQPLERDLNALLSGQPRKKRKGNEGDSTNKPIHVLVDIFISLLTKSPFYLRNAISRIFEQLVGYIDSSDIAHLFEVLERPDQEYIEEMDAQQ